MKFIRKEVVSIESEAAFRENIACDNETCGCRISNFLWVSHKYKLIYIEVPKNGCSTVKSSLKMQISDDQIVEAYLRKKIFQKHMSTTLSSIGFGNKIDLKVMKERVNVIMEKIDQGQLETAPLGKYEFQHSFDEPLNLANRYCDYEIFSIIRDPLDRFISGLNMFYDTKNHGRRLQRLSHSTLLSCDGIDVNLAAEDILSFPNHHFEAVHNFCGDLPSDRITWIPLNSLTKFLEAKAVKVSVRNVAKRKLFSANDLTEKNVNYIKNKYEIDAKIFAAIKPEI